MSAVSALKNIILNELGIGIFPLSFVEFVLNHSYRVHSRIMSLFDETK